MRRPTSQRYDGPATPSTGDLATTLTGLAALVVAGALLAVALTAPALVATALAVGLVARPAVRTARAVLARRRERGSTRVCVPHTQVCVEA